jgi:hypothetical protein
MLRSHFHLAALASAPAFALALVLGAVAPRAHAQGEIFLCTDADGRKVYQNTGSARGCKRVEVPPLITVPAPKVPAGGTSPRPAPNGVTPASFPKVEADTQRLRDTERRRILEDELKAEEDKLGKLRTEFNNGQPERQGDETRNFARYQERVVRMQEDIQRGENNVLALRRELAMLRQ